MNEVEKQILKNQRDMMAWLSKGNQYQGYFSERIGETEDLLNPVEEQSLPSKTADALRGKHE